MGEPKRILIVDDDPDVHRLLKAALDSPDRHMESAMDGLEGLRLAESSPYDLVITDVNMPGLDGMALLERIRTIRPETRVVVMTVASTPENVIHAIRERAFAYFSKPFTIHAIGAMVDNALRAAVPEDDIEVLSARPHWLALRLRCKLDTADRILQFLKELGTGIPVSEQENVGSAFREILLNAIEHGCGFDPDKKIVLAYVRTARALLYYVRDPGRGFSFENLSHAAISNNPGAPFEHTETREQLGMRPGGFGILMTRQLVDEMVYNEAGNEVILIKYLH
jgi:DNA-binding response OmpR family regulator